MALPAGVTTATLTFGSPASGFTGEAVSTSITVTPSISLTHIATGAPLLAFSVTVDAAEGMPGQVVLPHTDQDGFQDANGNAFKNWAYTVTGTHKSGKLRPIQFDKVIQLPSGVATVDLDLIPKGDVLTFPVTAPVARVTDVAGLTGSVSADSLSIALGGTGGGGAGATNAGVAAFITEAGETRTALDASYAAQTAPQIASIPARPRLRPKHLTIFAAGHGWTLGGSGTTDATLNDTVTPPALGSQSVRLQTDGGSTQAYVQTSNAPVTDYTNRHLALTVRVGDLTKLDVGSTEGKITVRAGSGSGATADNYMWILTGVIGMPYMQGEWVTLVLQFDGAQTNGTPDRAAIKTYRISTDDNGSGSSIVNVNSVGYVEAMPTPVISITLDDTRVAHYTEAYRMMSGLSMPGSLYPILERFGGAGYLTLAQAETMVHAGGWELGAHATTDITHATALPSMSDLDKNRELDALVAFNQSHGFPLETFAYPLGDFDAASVKAVRSRGLVGRGAYSPGNEIAPPPQPQNLRVWNIGKAGGGRSQAEITAWVDSVKAGNMWGIVLGHGIDATASSDPNATTVENFEFFVDYIASQGIEVRTVSDVMRGRYGTSVHY
jgi:peptidoglycan/xylan/chitin deacetylase (PgdA/CDA1 family)